MQDRKSAVRTVFIKVEKYTFWYDYTLLSCPQSASPQCVYQCGKKQFGIIILYMQVRKSAVRSVCINVEKYTFWYNYTLFSCPQFIKVEKKDIGMI